jgi:glutathione synthase/RimK-type ligase-like ATP-grasp enzyme
MIITRFSRLIREYHRLAAGDVFVGQVPSSFLKSALLADLCDRGIRLVPSATAQVLNASKVAQAFLLNPWMVPHTFAITRRRELLDAISTYNELGVSSAVTKADCLHCGHGVRKWDNLEILYSCLAFDEKAFPLVIQPHVDDFSDIRVVIAGDYIEAYSRSNPHNFRKNLAMGGHSASYILSTAEEKFCRALMQRAGMPYAHLDLMRLPDGAIFCLEIRLNGGIQGARIERRALEKLKQARLQELTGGDKSGIGQ